VVSVVVGVSVGVVVSFCCKKGALSTQHRNL